MEKTKTRPLTSTTTLSKRQQKIAMKQLSSTKENNTSFRSAERNFKAKFTNPNMENVVDFSNLENNSIESNSKILLVELSENLYDLDKNLFSNFTTEKYSSKEENDFQKPLGGRQIAYSLIGHPVLPNPFTETTQRRLIKNTLCEWARKPNKTSLDPFYAMRDNESLFERHIIDLTNYSNPEHEPFYYKSLFQDTSEAKESFEYSENQNTKNLSATSSDLQIASSTETNNAQKHNSNESNKITVTEPKNSFYRQNHTATELLDSLRWTTIGNQYNWTTKSYDTNLQIPIHSDLVHLMTTVVRSISQAKIVGSLNEKFSNNMIINDYDYLKYKVEAGVINYYGLDSTLLAHVDRSENNMEAPLVSISLGCSCIYLIGGETKDDIPTPILLRSGDIIASCGKSRSSFHGVPRIFQNSSPSYLTNPEIIYDSETFTSSTDPETLRKDQKALNSDWKPFSDYIASHRINFNARQCDF
ncbi:Alpha-ketoglutarate-dependent dioxygenase alkB [Smittium mucronatum]|uniref:Alpha-ketoglutarate-dependent dioxygenase alkB n=1 Tax=Smittium mucronatum TaxID=133383 RepID=A0A1R0H0W8_9FUNG|nr:Alpha-ketoglutarate-dependent dioxygenase alkB [Smittium mucronatum]